MDNIPVAHRLTTLEDLSPTGRTRRNNKGGYMSDEITVPKLTWVFHYESLERAIIAWREKLIADGVPVEDVETATNAILGFLASNEAKAQKMVLGEN